MAQAAHLTFQHVISSDLSRCQNPADEIASLYGASFTIDPSWRELNFGSWDGLHPTSVDSEDLGLFWKNPDANPPPLGERWSELNARVEKALEGIPEENTLIVAHGGSIRAAIAVLCGFSQDQLWAFDLPYASCLSLRIWPSPTGRTSQIIGLRT